MHLTRRQLLDIAGALGASAVFGCSGEDDGGPLRYRVRHRARLWAKGERPRLEQQTLEGDSGLS